jgi:hypothetical protein
VIALAAALAIAVTPVQYLQAHQAPSGGFAETRGAETAGLTAWSALALRARGAPTGKALDYLQANEDSDPTLVLLAEAALGHPTEALFDRVRVRIGSTVNATTWAVLALSEAAQPVPASARSYLLAHQARSGGWSWTARGAPDSNDTAAAIEALRAVRVSGRPIERGLAFLGTLQNRDGGFELDEGRGSDAQSTAWVIQAFLAAGRRPPHSAYAYLTRLRRPDGSYRYSAAYAATPVWVTAQVLPALAGRSFPLG